MTAQPTMDLRFWCDAAPGSGYLHAPFVRGGRWCASDGLSAIWGQACDATPGEPEATIVLEPIIATVGRCVLAPHAGVAHLLARERRERCAVCQGSGSDDGERTCDICQGDGRLRSAWRNRDFPCPACGRVGVITLWEDGARPCHTCLGTGLVPCAGQRLPRILGVTIPWRYLRAAAQLPGVEWATTTDVRGGGLLVFGNDRVRGVIVAVRDEALAYNPVDGDAVTAA